MAHVYNFDTLRSGQQPHTVTVCRCLNVWVYREENMRVYGAKTRTRTTTATENSRGQQASIASVMRPSSYRQRLLQFPVLPAATAAVAVRQHRRLQLSASEQSAWQQ
jgi:hypothetical protein